MIILYISDDSTNLNIEVQRLVVELILADGKPTHTIGVTNTKDHRRPVTKTSVRSTPDTSIFYTGSLWVNIVLSRCDLSLPLIVSVPVWVGQWKLGAWSTESWDIHVLTARVVCTADRNGLAELVLDIDITMSLHTKAVVRGVGLVKFSILAEKSTMGLTTGRLHIWPLGFAITWWTGIGTETSVHTLVTSTTVNLNTSVTTKLHPINRDCAISIREGTAVNFSIREFAFRVTVWFRGRRGGLRSRDWCLVGCSRLGRGGSLSGGSAASGGG